MSEPRQQFTISMLVNGVVHSGSVEARCTLSDFLRDDLDLTGTHVGCEHGVCGACTVIINGQLARSCLTLAVQADGCAVQTVEGLAQGDALHPLQIAFKAHHALQCGFCTPGFLITAAHLLEREPHPDEQQVREWLSGNLCRCTGYQSIVDAVLAVAKDNENSRPE